jgi:hypothetical protein
MDLSVISAIVVTMKVRSLPRSRGRVGERVSPQWDFPRG